MTNRDIDIISFILSGNFQLDIPTNSFREHSKVWWRRPCISMTTQFAKHETEAFSFAFITDNKLFYIIIPSCLAVPTCAALVIVSLVFNSRDTFEAAVWTIQYLSLIFGAYEFFTITSGHNDDYFIDIFSR